jgi:hypothetical protein
MGTGAAEGQNPEEPAPGSKSQWGSKLLSEFCDPDGHTQPFLDLNSPQTASSSQVVCDDMVTQAERDKSRYWKFIEGLLGYGILYLRN